MADRGRVNELYERFLETDEMQDWAAFIDMAKKALMSEPNAETVTVPAGFLRRVMTDISIAPTGFSAYRERFNQLCDEMGLPEEKEAIGETAALTEAGAEDMVARRKFSVRSKPLHYKGGPKEDEDGGDDTGGPF